MSEMLPAPFAGLSNLLDEWALAITADRFL